MDTELEEIINRIIEQQNKTIEDLKRIGEFSAVDEALVEKIEENLLKEHELLDKIIFNETNR